MGVPKRKVSRARRDSRATVNMKIDKKTIAACQTCQAPVVPHQVCKTCGYYKGIKIVRTKSDRMHQRNEIARAQQAKSKSTQEKTEDKE